MSSDQQSISPQALSSLAHHPSINPKATMIGKHSLMGCMRILHHEVMRFNFSKETIPDRLFAVVVDHTLRGARDVGVYARLNSKTLMGLPLMIPITSHTKTDSTTVQELGVTELKTLLTAALTATEGRLGWWHNQLLQKTMNEFFEPVLAEDALLRDKQIKWLRTNLHRCEGGKNKQSIFDVLLQCPSEESPDVWPRQLSTALVSFQTACWQQLLAHPLLYNELRNFEQDITCLRKEILMLKQSIAQEIDSTVLLQYLPLLDTFYRTYTYRNMHHVHQAWLAITEGRHKKISSHEEEAMIARLREIFQSGRFTTGCFDTKTRCSDVDAENRAQLKYRPLIESYTQDFTVTNTLCGAATSDAPITNLSFLNVFDYLSWCQEQTQFAILQQSDAHTMQLRALHNMAIAQQPQVCQAWLEAVPAKTHNFYISDLVLEIIASYAQKSDGRCKSFIDAFQLWAQDGYPVTVLTRLSSLTPTPWPAAHHAPIPVCSTEQLPGATTTSNTARSPKKSTISTLCVDDRTPPRSTTPVIPEEIAPPPKKASHLRSSLFITRRLFPSRSSGHHNSAGSLSPRGPEPSPLHKISISSLPTDLQKTTAGSLSPRGSMQPH